MSRIVSTLALLGGYMLIYAGIANGGRFVWQPWRGLFEDAYGGHTGQAPSASAPGNNLGTPNTAPYIPPGTSIPGKVPAPIIPGYPGTGRQRTPATPGGRG